MRAIVIENFGGRDQLKLAERPKPVPARGEVLIRVRAAGCNPVDYKIREGILRMRLPHMFPIIPGWDVAGVVESVGSKTRRFKVGDEVFAYCRKPLVMHGTYAEFVAVKASHVAHKPKQFSFEEAAAVPLAGLTALQTLFEAGEFKRGKVVLIHAAAGGVGQFAVQLAKTVQCRVIGTCGPDNRSFLIRQLGVDHVIDYAHHDFVAETRLLYPNGVDLVLDYVGGETQVRSAEVLKRGGKLVSILHIPDEAALRAKGVDPRYVFVRPSRRQLTRLAKLADAGKLKPFISATFPLEEAARAHELLEGRHTRGKIVLKVASQSAA